MPVVMEMGDGLPPCPTWDELAAICRAGREDILAYLDRWPEELRDTVALALSVAHWSPEERARMLAMCGDCEFAMPIYYFGSRCGLCARHRGCHGCPMKPRCDKDESLWQRAIRADVQGPAADAMYNELVRLYANVWEKLPEVEE